MTEGWIMHCPQHSGARGIRGGRGPPPLLLHITSVRVLSYSGWLGGEAGATQLHDDPLADEDTHEGWLHVQGLQLVL